MTHSGTAAGVLERENPDYVVDAIKEVLPICLNGW